MFGGHFRALQLYGSTGPTYEDLVPEDAAVAIEPIASAVGRNRAHQAAIFGRRPSLRGWFDGEGSTSCLELRKSSPGLRTLTSRGAATVPGKWGGERLIAMSGGRPCEVEVLVGEIYYRLGGIAMERSIGMGQGCYDRFGAHGTTAPSFHGAHHFRRGGQNPR